MAKSYRIVVKNNTGGSQNYAFISESPVISGSARSPVWTNVVESGDALVAEVLAALHANGDGNDALMRFEMEQINTAIHKETIQKEASFLDFVRTPGNRRRLAALVALACSLNWMGNGIITYYLAPVLTSVGITAPVQITLINYLVCFLHLQGQVASTVTKNTAGLNTLGA
ncbi:hypothetical protein ACJZ2D_004844 [Fusarium nematophilum]